jgi:hypothetical protein
MRGMGIIVAPLAALAAQQSSYALVASRCALVSRWQLLLIIAAGGAVTLLSLIVALRGRRDFLALSGALASAFSLLVVIALAIPLFFLAPCTP